MKKKDHLWKRIFSQHAILILMVFTFLSVTMLMTLSHAVQRERRATMEEQLEICSSKLDTRVDEVMNLHLQILNNSLFRSCMRSHQQGEMTTAQSEKLANLLYTTRDTSWLVNCIYVLDGDFEIVSSTRVILSDDRNVAQVKAAAASLAESQAFRAFYMTEGRLLFLGAVYLDDSYDYVTYLGIELNPSRMFFNFASTALESFQSVFVADGGEIVTVAGESLGFEPEDLDGVITVERGGVSYAVFSCRNSGYANWKIYALMDESAFFQVIRQQSTMMILTVIAAIVAALILSLLFSKRITQPLEQLTSSFRRLEQGEYPPPLDVGGNDEVGQLIQSYNHVVQSLQKLNENIIIEQEEKRRFEIAAVKTRLDLLQSQIRPHFIHNTLNTLNYMAIEAGNHDLSELITSFNALLRMSISTDSDFCTVESEISCIKHYLRIQRCRYADRPLQCNYTVDEQAKSALLPRLVLQPLVENALYHGILPVEDRLGVIQVQCTTVGDYLCVSVSDNGAGITEEILNQLHSGQTVSPGGYNHIGIQNVKERLQLMYHQECEFKILSEVGSGTTIYFSVPYKR